MSLKQILLVTGFRPYYIWLNIKYNYFSKSIIRHGNAKMLIYPDCILSISPSARIEIFGDLVLGKKSLTHNSQISKLLMLSDSRIIVKKRCDILDAFDIQVHKGGLLEIGEFHSNIGLEISCGSNISIDTDVVAGRHVRIKDYNGHYVSYDGYPLSKPITINKHVWLCTGSTINPGVIVGEGSVIADNANVIADIEPHTFNQGNPSIIIERNITFKM